MSFMQKIKNLNWLVFAVLLVNVCLVTYYFSLREDFYVDEYFTIGQSNSKQGAYLLKGIDSARSLHDISEFSTPLCFSADDVRNYMVVKKGEGFDYRNVVENLKSSVHPPLYYFLTHTIYSFFPEQSNKWFNFPINIVFFVLTFFMVYALARNILKDKFLSLLAVILFGFCLTTLNMAVFVRSYIVQMFAGTALFYYHYRLLQQEKLKYETLFAIFLFSYLGFLTHFYFLVFGFILAALTCFCFMLRREDKNMIIYALVMLAAVDLFFISFPPAMDLLFKSDRGVEVQEMNFYSSFLYSVSLQAIVRFLMQYIFSFSGLYENFLLWCICFGALIITLQNEREKTSSGIKVLSVCCFLFLLVVAVVSPNMGIYKDRYFSPIAPTICVLMVYYISLFFKSLRVSDIKNKIILAVIVLLSVFNTNWQERSPYYYKVSDDTRYALETFKDKNLVLVVNNITQVISFAADYPYFKSLCAFSYRDKKNKFLQEIQGKDFDYLIVRQILYTDLSKPTPVSKYPENMFRLDHLTFFKTFRKGLFVFSSSKFDDKK